MTYESTNLTSLGIEEFQKFLSPPRLDKYLEFADRDLEEALRLYKENLEISIAFQIPLHFCEIAIRNAVAETLRKAHGRHWPWEPGVTRSLNDWSLDTLKNAIGTKAKGRGIGSIVANLNFGFLEHMFTEDHSGLWLYRIRNAFPNLPDNKNSDELRKILKDEINKVRILRNKIAHHERIIESTRDFNPTAELYRISKLIYWRSTAAAEWLKSFERDGYFSAIHEYRRPRQ